MHRKSISQLIPFDYETERTLRNLRKTMHTEERNIAENKMDRNEERNQQ